MVDIKPVLDTSPQKPHEQTSKSSIAGSVSTRGRAAILGAIDRLRGRPRAALEQITTVEDSPTTPTPRQSSEASSSTEKNANNPFTTYLRERLSDDSVFQASQFARELPPDRRGEYQTQIEEAARDIVGILAIDTEIFRDPRCAEAFFSVCDSWVVNESTTTNPNYQQERQFLIEFSRLLAHNRSGYNTDALASGEPNARFYLPDTAKESDEKIFQLLRSAESPTKSDQINQLLRSREKGSILADQREKLHISSAEDENPFRVIVVDKSKREKWNSDTQQLDPSPWLQMQHQMDEIQGNSKRTREAAMFVILDPSDKTPTMVLPEEDADILFSQDENQEWEKDGAQRMIRHEWVHTQRPMTLGPGYTLGLIWEERRAITISESGGHSDTGVLFRMMRWLGDGQHGDALHDSFEKASDSPTTQAEFMKHIADTFGLRSSLLLLAAQPAQYPATYGISVIPGVRLDSQDRMGDILDTVIRERSAIAPESSRHLEDAIRTHSEEDARILFYLSRNGRIRLPENIQTILNQKVGQNEN